MTPTDRAAVSQVSTPVPGFEDGLGLRRQTIDAAGEAIELLCLRPELAAVPSFEFALRERVARLAGFRHAFYGRVRSVERLSDGTSALAVVSDYTSGLRLSAMLTAAEARHVPLDINAALCLLRQLVPAVAMLHERARDVAHGAIGPERLVVSDNARLVIVEYAMGAALEQLRYGQERYWGDLRVPTIALSGLPRFDQRADVAQIGMVALALILGRPLQRDEYPARLNDLVASTWAVSAKGGFEPLPPGLRGWLARALQLDPRNGFPSAIEARAELERVLGDSDFLASPASLDAFLARFHASARSAATISEPTRIPTRPDVTSVAFQHEPTNAPVPMGPAPAPWDTPKGETLVPLQTAVAIPPDSAIPPAAAYQAAPALPAVPASQTSTEPPRPSPSLASDDAPRVAQRIIAEAGDGRAPLIEPPQVQPSPFEVSLGTPFMESFPQPEDTPSRWPRLAAGAALFVVLLGAGAYGWQRFSAPAPAAAPMGTLSVDSNPTGIEAYVDGALRGKTPLTLSLAAGAHRLELRGAGDPRVVPITVTAGAQLSQYIELPKSDPKAGQLQIRTEPAGAKVVVDGVSVGVSPMTVIDLAPGEHSVALEAEGNVVRQAVKVEAGATSSLIVPMGTPVSSPSSGWISVAVPFEVQLFEGGRLLGSSRSDRIMVAAGRHELDLVNDEVGFKDTRTVQVGAGKIAPIKVDVPSGTIALNAVPWAEVWIDGEKLGETPIGNHALPLGRHDVLFRHPELGEQHHTAVVTLKAPARLSVDMRKKP